MRPLYAIIIAALVLLTSCHTLDKREIWQLERDAPSPLALQPAYDLHKYRYDIIRQTRSEMGVDSTCVTENVAYHTLGFDLGNGLFFDLNDNLGIDLTDMLRLGQGDFEVARVQPNGRIAHRFFRTGDHLCFGRKPADDTNLRKCLEIEKAGDEIIIRRKDKVLSSVLLDDDTLAVANRRGKQIARISETGNGEYAEGVKRTRASYVYSPDQVKLHRYTVKIDEAQKEILIYRQKKNKQKLLYRVIRGEDKLFIFDPRYRGSKIEFTDDGISVYTNRRKLYDLSADR